MGIVKIVKSYELTQILRYLIHVAPKQMQTMRKYYNHIFSCAYPCLDALVS